MAIAYDNSAQFSSASNPATSAYTVTGSNTLLVVRIYDDSGSDNVTGVTYNSVAMTQTVKQTLTSGNRVYTYTLLGASTGSNTISISKTGASTVLVTVASYTGVSQTGFPDAVVSDTGTTTGNITKSITTIANNCWVISTYCDADGITISAGAGNTLRQSLVSGAVSAILDSNAAITPAGNFDSIINKSASAVRWGRNNFSIAPAATTAVKTVNGLAQASVKTVNDLAIASVKTINGLA